MQLEARMEGWLAVLTVNRVIYREGYGFALSCGGTTDSIAGAQKSPSLGCQGDGE